MPSVAAADRLRARCARTAGEPGDIAFVVEAPSDDDRLALATDRGGLVVARTATVDDAVDVVAAHLSVGSVADGMTRLRARAVIHRESGRVRLLQWPFGFAPPLIERRLGQAGWSAIDRFVVDVGLDDDGAAHVQFEADWDSDIGCVGHAGAPRGRHRVDAFIGVGQPVSLAAAVASIAAAAQRGSAVPQALETAEALAATWIGADGHKAVYAAIRS